MSRFREWEPLKQDNTFRFEDRKVLERLMKCKKLTERQREAIRRLLANFDYMRD